MRLNRPLLPPTCPFHHRNSFTHTTRTCPVACSSSAHATFTSLLTDSLLSIAQAAPGSPYAWLGSREASQSSGANAIRVAVWQTLCLLAPYIPQEQLQQVHPTTVIPWGNTRQGRLCSNQHCSIDVLCRQWWLGGHSCSKVLSSVSCCNQHSCINTCAQYTPPMLSCLSGSHRPQL